MSEKNRENDNERLEERFGDEQNTENENESKGGVKKASTAVIILVFILFVFIIFFTDAIEVKFGKTAGTLALVIIAAVIAVLLYKKEIVEFFKGKRKDGKK